MQSQLMTQYKEMKRKHPDAILLFRIGDFYETFGEDAIAASEILGIALVRRAKSKSKFVELAGFPHYSLDTYLPKLIRAGKRVAICEQLQDPKKLCKSPTRQEANHNDKECGSETNEVFTLDLASLFGFLNSVIDAMVVIHTIKKIQKNTAQIQSLSRSLKISPKLAFNACYQDLITPKEISLFDTIYHY